MAGSPASSAARRVQSTHHLSQRTTPLAATSWRLRRPQLQATAGKAPQHDAGTEGEPTLCRSLLVCEPQVGVWMQAAVLGLPVRILAALPPLVTKQDLFGV